MWKAVRNLSRARNLILIRVVGQNQNPLHASLSTNSTPRSNSNSQVVMSAPTDTTTELMTEHLQYAPITLIDDVINSANAVLYQAMDAFETYLRDTLIPSIPSSKSTQSKTFDLDAPEDSEREALYKEVEFGMAQVETLLENAVDRNFDAFELYVLRNVFNIPEDIDGYIRLKHHQVDYVWKYLI